MTPSLEQLLAKPVYQAYAYSYPHKTAYREFSQPVKLEPVWQQEKLDALFLYVHIPFCSMRCGFCNLFTLVKPQQDLPDLYLDALERQIKALDSVISQAKFARFAIGGGTPTYLSVEQLERLFELTNFSAMQDNTPIGIECSPETVTVEKIQLLQTRGVDRISMGIQSFSEAEVKNLLRRQKTQEVIQAIEIIRQNSQADLNLDLIYGIAGQTIKSWNETLTQALKFKPEEFYLYPLYVRNKTGLGTIKDRQSASTRISQDNMLALYRTGRDKLLSEGYQQVSMRMFRRTELSDVTYKQQTPPVYSCQEDAMLGLGSGARSYTSKLHYSSEYAVGRHGVKDIIVHYLQQTSESFSYTNYGVKLTEDEQKRRFVMQSLLISDGLNLLTYQQKFNSNCLQDFPLLPLLIDKGLAYLQKGLPHKTLKLSEQGVERSDSIGSWFVSDSVKQAMSEYTLR